MTVQQIVRVRDGSTYHLSDPPYIDGVGGMTTTHCGQRYHIGDVIFSAKDSDETHIPGFTICRTCLPLVEKPANDEVNHPSHYGGEDNPYEAIKVIEAWALDFNLGNAIKYICRAGQKEGTDPVNDLKKARWYLDREIQNASNNPS